MFSTSYIGILLYKWSGQGVGVSGALGRLCIMLPFYIDRAGPLAQREAGHQTTSAAARQSATEKLYPISVSDWLLPRLLFYYVLVKIKCSIKQI